MATAAGGTGHDLHVEGLDQNQEALLQEGLDHLSEGITG